MAVVSAPALSAFLSGKVSFCFVSLDLHLSIRYEMLAQVTLQASLSSAFR